MQIKATIRQYYTPIWMTKIKIFTISNTENGAEKVEYKMVQSLWKSVPYEIKHKIIM